MAVAARTPVLVADDHAPTRALVREALERDQFDVVAEAATAMETVEAARRVNPQVALLDIRMPGGGIDAAESLAALEDAPAIVMLTASQDDDDLFAALRAGASGYLLKGMNTADLPGQLRERRRLLTTTQDRTRRLTWREWELLELMAAGLTTAQIASQLYINPATVRSHVMAIVRKLQVPNRRAAVAFFRSGRYGAET